MIVKYLQAVRTERKPGSKKKFRYMQPAILKCELCGVERKVDNLTGKQKASITHVCLSCAAKQNGYANKGKPNANRGKVKPQSEVQKGGIYVNSSGYLEIYLGFHYNPDRKSKYTLLHRLVAELKLQRPLSENEIIHHIDGDRFNNNPNNLFICEDMRDHKRIHTDLHKVALQLVKSGVIQFDPDTKTHFVPHLEEILNVYCVNSGEPYVLSIEKSGDMAILSQAESINVSEGATTIPLGSRDQEISKRTAS